MSGDNTATQQTHADVVQGQVANNTHKTVSTFYLSQHTKHRPFVSAEY